VTPQEHAATVREEVQSWLAGDYDAMKRYLAALDALLAQAETAETYRADRDEYDALLGRKMAERDAAVRERDQARDALRQIIGMGDHIVDDVRKIARAALSAREEGWDEEAFVAEMHRRAAREEVWTHEDRMVLGEGGC
jgi:hypothetical protein